MNVNGRYPEELFERQSKAYCNSVKKGRQEPPLLPSPGRSIEMQKVLHISQQKDRQADRELDKRQKLWSFIEQ